MRTLISAVLVLSVGCGEGTFSGQQRATQPCAVPGPSAWERLETKPVIFEFHPGTSLGSFTTHRARDVGPPLPTPLRLTSGRVELLAGWHSVGPLLSVTRFEGALADVHLSQAQLPPSGLTLTNGSFKLSRGVALPVRWLGDGAVGLAAGAVPVEVHLSLLLSTGEVSPLEVGHLDALPVELVVERSAGEVLLLTAKAAQPGVLWSWGGLLELGNLAVTLEASEAGALLELPAPTSGAAP